MKSFNQFLTEADEEYVKRVPHPSGNRKEYVDANNFLHNVDDLPAVVYHKTGKKMWFKHGKLHRLLGPAVVDPDLTRKDVYYINGKRIEKSEFEKITKDIDRSQAFPSDALDI